MYNVHDCKGKVIGQVSDDNAKLFFEHVKGYVKLVTDSNNNQFNAYIFTETKGMGYKDFYIICEVNGFLSRY